MERTNAEANAAEPDALDRDGEQAATRRLAQAAQVIRIESEAVGRLIERLGPDFVAAVDLVLQCRGMVVVTGMGKAGLIGAKISATLASTGTPSIALHPGDALHGDLGRLRRDDLLLALSNSGETVELKALVPAARRIGARIVAVTERRESTLGRLADRVLELGPVGEACPLGLAPTASTSAMLALGDALAMVVLEERGFGRDDYARFHPAGALGRRLARVAEFMRTGEELPVASERSTLRQVLEVASRTPGRPGAVLLTDNGGLLTGIFTDGDLRRLLVTVDGAPRDEIIADHMGRTPKTVRPEQLVEEAMHLINLHKVDQLPVIDGSGYPVGLLDVQDVLDLEL